MKKKTSYFFGLICCLILFSSCFQQRKYDRLLQDKGGKTSLITLHPKKEETFNPDKIDLLSDGDYISRYEGLTQAPKLTFSKAEGPKPLTKEEMVEDFDFYFNTLESNYPFFEVLKREDGINFLGNYSEYRSRVENCKTDKDFIEVMNRISSELKNSHVVIADRPYVEATLSYYSSYFDIPSIYREFLNLNKKNVRARYGIEGVQSKKSQVKRTGGHLRKGEVQEDFSQNMEVSELDKETLFIKIHEMADEETIQKDKEILAPYLKDINKYKKLVIDIRNNSGGNMRYRQEFFLPQILQEEVSTTNHMFFKNGRRTKDLLDRDKVDYENIENVDLSKLDLDHKEDLNDFSFYAKNEIDIKPAGKEGFAGKIYLLVDSNVYSAAEGLASFCKNTGLASLVGEETGGDGITLGVLNDVMPNSGLVFSYTNTLGYTEDGKINEEENTHPDIYSESLKKSLDLIKND